MRWRSSMWCWWLWLGLVGPGGRAGCVQRRGHLVCHREHVAGGELVAEDQPRPPTAVLVTSDAAGNSICTASFIHARYVLTAAHCTLDRHVEGLFAGSLDGKDSFTKFKYYKSEHGKYYNIPVANVTIHPKYYGDDHFNDLSILKLASDVKITPIKLYGKPELPDETIKVIGYGKYRTEDLKVDMDSKLRAAEVPVLPPDMCKMQIACLEESCICAGGKNKGTMAGDSGGPAYIELNGQFYQVGIASFGRKEEQITHTDTYMRVSYYCDFIAQATEGNVKCEEPETD